MKKLIAFLILIHSTAFAVDEEPIVVRLATEKDLMPLYVEPTLGDSFGPGYLKKLEEVFKFDLNHNGKTVTTQKKDQRAFYVVQLKVKDGLLNVELRSTHSDVRKGIEGIKLSGDLGKDRREIHRVADMIHQTLFGLDGIASTKILYTIRENKGDKWASEVWEADYDGKNARQLTHDGGYCVTPTYVPPKPGFSCGSFFYVSYKTGQPKIYVASLKDGIGHRLTLLRGNQLMPVVSRQRNQIAFISDVTGNPDLFLQPFDPKEGAIGKPRQIFSAHLATQGTPTFSPDGKRIAFVSNKDGSPRIYAMTIPSPGAKLKEIKPRLISKYVRGATAPTWSPDGTKIAYCALTEGVRQIWVYDFVKDDERQLTQGYGNKENPTWAPNSLSLMFNSTGHNGSELYMINLNQSKATKITSGRGEKRFPQWELVNRG